VAIDIADNGPGVPAEARERVFEPLFTTKLKGTGLGLAVVQTFVRRHGGVVSVLEQEPGAGATFRVVLPIGEPSRGEAPATGGAADLRA
jgi:signal transduction histidine kinase